MRLNFIFCLTVGILSPILSFTQNLIPNSGFELYKKTPSSTSQWDRVKDWINPDNSTDNPGTPDYFHTKGSSVAHLPSPKKIFPELIVIPHEGNAVAGIIGNSSNNLHEYITAPLTKRISKGDTVRVSFYFTNGKGKPMGKGMTKLGTYFSSDIVRPYEGAILTEPQTEMEKPVFSNEWVLYKKEFIAREDYNYITIGCFRFADQNTFQPGSDVGYFGSWAYYFIDGCEVKTTPDAEGRKDISVTSTNTEGTKFVFRGEDTNTGLKVKGRIVGANIVSFEDSVYMLSKTSPKIQVFADAPGYYPFHETIEENNENKTNLIYLKRLKKGTTIVLKNIQFNSGSPVILPSSYEELDKLVVLLNANPYLNIEIGGHTDNLGDPQKDQELSEQRAKNVMAYLISKGIPEKRLSARGYGMLKPISENKAAEGRAKNRRVEFIVK